MPLYFYVLLGIAALGLIVYLIAVFSPTFANWYNSTLGAALRALLAHITSWIPFSLAEMLIYCIPLIIVAVVVVAYRYHCGTWKAVFVFLGSILSVFSLFFSVFAFGFGVGYHTDSLDKRLALSAENIEQEELYQTALWLVEQVNLTANEVKFGEDGFSVMPYDIAEMNRLLLDAYEPVCHSYPFIQRLNSRVKPVLASKWMSYTHVTGVYSYFTGEANINVAFPDYTIPYTTAHELAHQRGIARENEANFIAFLVTKGSDDPYIRYSGYLNLFEYVGNALYSVNEEHFAEVMGLLDGRVKGELRAYSAFFDAYRDSLAADVSNAVNDTYLKLHGNKAGSASYGLVVELAVAYHRQASQS